MKPFSQLVDAVETLSDPEVEDYFLKILKSPELAAEDKYQKFIDFFRKESQIRTRMLHYARQGTSGRPGVDILSQVCQDLKLWNPQEMLGQTEESIKRAVRRLRDSQNQAPPEARGGWGFGWKQSDCWATVHAVLCLNAARGLKRTGLRRGY